MKINDVLKVLEQWAPPSLQESYDNAGLLTGDKNDELTSAVICLDSIESVVDEAIEKGANLIIAHHPIVFSGLKKFTGATYPERVIIKAIRNNIAIYAIHTNLDNVSNGVSKEMADRLGLKNQKILKPLSGKLKKLTVYVPPESVEQVRAALFNAGAGAIGNYSECSFITEGQGTFKPGEGSDPYSGEQGKVQNDAELRIEVVAPSWRQQEITAAMIKAHPYEEVAYDWVMMDNLNQDVGAGMIGELETPVTAPEFLAKIKAVFGGMIRHTSYENQMIRKVALCGGSGSFLLGDALRNGADLFLTADFKYHQFFDAEEKIIIADIGHFESEQFTMELILRYLMDIFPNFAGRITEIRTNPIHYF